MTRLDHLLIILVEECAESAQRATKALRFGENEVQPGNHLNNADRLRVELNDLVAVWEMLEDEGVIGGRSATLVEQKKAKVEQYLKYSEQCGTLKGQP